MLDILFVLSFSAFQVLFVKFSESVGDFMIFHLNNCLDYQKKFFLVKFFIHAEMRQKSSFDLTKKIRSNCKEMISKLSYFHNFKIKLNNRAVFKKS